LKRFPVDRIKIDQSFVRNITSDPADAAVSQAIISMSHSLNLVTLAEGVETEAQREFLRSRHCNEMQGHHFSPAITAQAMEEMMRSGRCLDAPSASHAHHERTLLLLDDDEYLLAALASTLHTEGYRILCATCPGEALDFLAKHPVGVIISEHHLPEMTGIELFSKLRHLHPAVVRIMLTGNNDTALTSAAINQGAVFKFVVKPWDNEELRAQVRDAFRHYERLHLLKPQQAAA
ncbi:MAG TPA: EAL domain-containing protein, partial [Gallionellaceae bacterium]